MDLQLNTLGEMARNAEIRENLWLGLAGLSAVIMLVGFIAVCYWLRRIHAVLKAERAPFEKGVAKAPPLRI